MEKLLKDCIQPSVNKMESLSWTDRQLYGDFLAQTYHFVCHSTRLLALAASRLPLNQEELFRRFTAHIGEEKSHERLAESDLKGLGLSLAQVQERPETRAFYESQYYKIEHQSPTALLGYILFLESIAVEAGPKVYGQTSEAFGDRACRFLKVHVEEDPDHVDKALHSISAIAERFPEQALHIRQNLVQSATLYHHMLSAIGSNETLIERNWKKSA